MLSSFIVSFPIFHIPSVATVLSWIRPMGFLLPFIFYLLSGAALAQSPPALTGGKNIAGENAVAPARYSLQELAGQAESIVHGRVTTLKSSWNEGKTRIYTVAMIEVGEIWKGEPVGPTLEVRYPGGEVGDVGEMYTHLPTFKADEEVVVFTKRSADGNRLVVGGMQGKMSITADHGGVKKIGGTEVPLAEMKRIVTSAGADR